MGEQEFKDWLHDYLHNEMKEALDEELAKLPWWCGICGEGGNYEGKRPAIDQCWFPPEDHTCFNTSPEVNNFEDVKGLHPVISVVDEPYSFKHASPMVKKVVRHLDQLKTQAYSDALVKMYELDKPETYSTKSVLPPHPPKIDDIIHNIFYKE